MLLRFLFPVLPILLILSCGRENEESGKKNPVTDTEEREVPAGRYSAIVLEKNCGFWTDCAFIIRADFSRRPLVLEANFLDSGWPSEQGSSTEGKCEFEVALSDAEARALEIYADGLRICQTENTPSSEREFDGAFITLTSGGEAMAYKSKTDGQNEDGKINYLCRGRAAYYSYMKKLIVPKAPPECPSGYKRLFR